MVNRSGRIIASSSCNTPASGSAGRRLHQLVNLSPPGKAYTLEICLFGSVT
jgi:hypothetical protein